MQRDRRVRSIYRWDPVLIPELKHPSELFPAVLKPSKSELHIWTIIEIRAYEDEDVRCQHLQ